MPKKVLDLSNIQIRVHHVGGKAVSEEMRIDVLRDPRFFAGPEDGRPEILNRIASRSLACQHIHLLQLLR